jgi:alpha-N-arabinofuranosidase
MIRQVTSAALAFSLIIVAAGSRQAKADPATPPAGTAEKPVAPRIAIDAGKMREPISKYIYGQFIEHLGRCIYGGIWAEMLEDRKFFYTIGDDKSPWKVIGRACQVTNDPQRPLVGTNVPRITLAGDGRSAGIAQGELALRKGKQYVGRIWLAGSEEVGPISVSLIWGDGPDGRQTITIDRIAENYAETPLRFTAAADTESGRLEITAAGFGSFYAGTVSLMPADNVQGMRADTLAAAKKLDAPICRWPGGNFASGYDWKDGVGPRDRRPPRKNLAWKGIDSNDFGLDEFLTFCRLLGTEPYITVNSGLGDKQLAVEELQYANAPANRPGGRWRAKNGHPAPYGVKWWSIGNEMYGNWQLGHMTLERYVKKHNAFAEAMRAADPSIKLIGDGEVGKWTKGMLEHCAEQMDLISEHFYRPERPKSLAAHVAEIPDAIRSIATAHRGYRQQLDSLRGKDIRIALDEWNYWYAPHKYGDYGTPYYLKDALGIAAGLHEFARQSDLFFMANYAQTVNVLGCIKTSKTAAALDTTGVALALYRKHFGTLPVAVVAAAPLDVAAAWTADRQALTVGIVNPALKACDISLEITGAKLSGSGTRWQIAGSDPMAHNAPGKVPLVKVEQSPVRDLCGKLSVAPCSVTLLSLEAP